MFYYLGAHPLVVVELEQEAVNSIGQGGKVYFLLGDLLSQYLAAFLVEYTDKLGFHSTPGSRAIGWVREEACLKIREFEYPGNSG